MSVFYDSVSVKGIIGIILFIAAFVLLNEATRRSLKISIFAFGVLPVLLALGVYLDVLGSPTGNTWFGWVKVVSALIGVYGFLLIRFTSIGNKKFALLFPGAILAINIAEAVYREFEVYFTYQTLTVDPGGILIQGGIWNIFNGIAGILCILTLTGFAGIKVSKDASRDMIWPDMTWLYIIGYTIWNFAYVYNCISTRSLYAGFGILTAALLGEWMFKRGAWLQHRAQILSLYAMFSLSVDFQNFAYFSVLPTYSENVLFGLSLASLTINIGVFAVMVYTIMKHKINPIKQEIYIHTPYYKKTMEQSKLA